MRDLPGYVVTEEMARLWDASHATFLIREADGTSPELIVEAEEKLWPEYYDLFEAANRFKCPECDGDMAGHWCVWYCCCPIAPYLHYCASCCADWYRDEAGTFKRESFLAEQGAGA